MDYFLKIPQLVRPEVTDNNDFKDENFIEIKTSSRILVDMQYFKRGIEGATDKCYVRKTVFDKLKKAAKLLPKGYCFRIFDAWRPLCVQKELYENLVGMLENEMSFSTEYEKAKWIESFVSYPSDNRFLPPVHCTGGAMDLTIVDDYGIDLKMGTGFDEFKKDSFTTYYETSDELAIKNNRRMLFNIMTGAGFTNLPSEWWHYDYGTRFWSFYTGKPTKYSGIFVVGEIQTDT